MSEYQYYEFQAIDRPLTSGEMSEVRKLSTRALITPTQFQNVYHYGNFKGDPVTLVERYYDALVYLANWGTHQFMLRLPSRVLNGQSARLYAIEGVLDVRERGDVVILEFVSEDDEDSYGWVDDDESARWMPSLLGVRGELAGGDLRALYLGWLAGARAGFIEDHELEPPVPAGLGSPSASLESLARFMRLDEDLLAVAASGSSASPPTPSVADLEQWVVDLPVSGKNDLLVRLVNGEVHLRAEIERRFRDGNASQQEAQTRRRTVAEILSAADSRAEARRQEEAERAAAERKAREQEQAAARSRYLERLVGQEHELWRQVEALCEMKRPKEYDEAVRLLIDLYELSVRQGTVAEFTERIGPFRARNAKRPSLINRLDQAGLPV